MFHKKTKKNINIGVIGLGNIGSYFCNEILKKKRDIFIKTGKKVNLLYVSAKNKNKKRLFKITKSNWVKNPIHIAESSKIDIVVELIGGSDGLSKKIALTTLKNKKHLITANKSLIAKHGNLLSILAEKNKVNLEYEASVAAGIPIIRNIKEGLISNRISKIVGILNGTSNYILSRMEKKNRNFNEILKEAKKFGYAETNPKSDLNGDDVKSKIKILSSLCFKTLISEKDILVDGINKIEIQDINNAKKLGYRIKLLGITEIKGKKIFERVHPSLVNVDSYIGNINGVFNALIINGLPVGQSVMQGEGAGPGPTSSALMSDLYSILRGGTKYPFIKPYKLRKKISQFDYLNYAYSCYLRFEVKDKPGVLSSITKILAENNISIERLLQIPNKKNNTASIVIITHKTIEKKMIKCLKKLRSNNNLIKSPTFIRVGDNNDN